jgi:hypothetical protein
VATSSSESQASPLRLIKRELDGLRRNLSPAHFCRLTFSRPLFRARSEFPAVSMASSAVCDMTNTKLDELVKEGSMSQDTRKRCRAVRGEAEPRPRPGEVVAFVHYFRAGLDFPVSPFLHGVLFNYRISLHHLAPNAVTALATFAAFCEGWLGIWPDLNIFLHYFRGVATSNRGDCPWGSGSLYLQLRGADRPFISIPRISSNSGWRKGWFYVDTRGLPEMPAFTSAAVEPSDRLAWGTEKKMWRKYAAAAARIDQLRTRGLIGLRVIAEFIQRRIAPLAVRSRGMWEFTGAGDDDRLAAGELSQAEVRRRLQLLVGTVSDETWGSLGGLPQAHWSGIPVAVSSPRLALFAASLSILLTSFPFFRSQEPLSIPRGKLPLPEAQSAGQRQAEHDAQRGQRRKAKAAQNARRQRRLVRRQRGEEVRSDSDSLPSSEESEAEVASEGARGPLASVEEGAAESSPRPGGAGESVAGTSVDAAALDPQEPAGASAPTGAPMPEPFSPSSARANKRTREPATVVEDTPVAKRTRGVDCPGGVDCPDGSDEESLHTLVVPGTPFMVSDDEGDSGFVAPPSSPSFGAARGSVAAPENPATASVHGATGTAAPSTAPRVGGLPPLGPPGSSPAGAGAAYSPVAQDCLRNLSSIVSSIESRLLPWVQVRAISG